MRVSIPEADVILGPVLDFHFEKYQSLNELAPKGITYGAAFNYFFTGAFREEQETYDAITRFLKKFM